LITMTFGFLDIDGAYLAKYGLTMDIFPY